MRRGEKKRERFAMLVCVILLLAVSGCRISSETGGAAGTEDGTQEETGGEQEGSETYRFVDVEGKEYEAELLPEVPKNTYDYARITEKDGYKCYVNEEGETASRLGIDVSMFQPEADWTKVKEAGIEFVMVRLGYRGYGEEGNLVEDEYFCRHVEGALAAGLDVGVYFFSQAKDKEEALEEAAFVLERIKEYEITYPVVFDTEEIKYDTARTDNLSGEQFTENCRVFCDAVKEAGYDTMIYANMKWLAFVLNLEKLTEYDVWYADYEPVPQNPYKIRMWQYTEEGQVDGISGNVDINLLFL